MRIVLDTNVLVAGQLNPYGRCGDVVRLVFDGRVTLLVDARITAEYAEVLARPRFGFDPAAVRVLLDFIDSTAEVTAAVPLTVWPPDRDDEPFLEVAAAGHADALVTGNAAHFPAASVGAVTVLAPAAFVDCFAGRTS